MLSNQPSPLSFRRCPVNHWTCACGGEECPNPVGVIGPASSPPEPLTADSIRAIAREEIERALAARNG